PDDTRFLSFGLHGATQRDLAVHRDDFDILGGGRIFRRANALAHLLCDVAIRRRLALVAGSQGRVIPVTNISGGVVRVFVSRVGGPVVGGGGPNGFILFFATGARQQRQGRRERESSEKCFHADGFSRCCASSRRRPVCR